MRRPSLLGLIYLVIGVLVAAGRGHLEGISGFPDLISLLLVIVLWPLVLLGFDIAVRGGGRRGAYAPWEILGTLPWWPSLSSFRMRPRRRPRRGHTGPNR